ncbi:MAG: GAF domain-containing protein [Pyrinomonadaceae bacterium]
MNDEDFGAEEGFAAELREAINAVDLSNSLTTPLKGAIEKLLQLAARAVDSQVASVLVRDGNEGGLKFLTAISEAKAELLKLRIPPGKGIAGLVFSTGQPTCVADVRGEGSFWSRADEQTGFKTITLLATPLRLGHETIGVLEFVNRPGEPPYPPFTPEEMDRADPFANAIARLVDAHEMAELVESLFAHSIKISMEMEGIDLDRDTREWIRRMDAAPEHRDLLLLGVSLRDIVSRGDSERELCRDLLEAISRFTEKRSASTGYAGL